MSVRTALYVVGGRNGAATVALDHDMDDIPSLAECVQELDIVHAEPWAVLWCDHIMQKLRARNIDIEPDIREAHVSMRRPPKLLRFTDDHMDLTFIDWKWLTFDEGVTVPPARHRRCRAWYGSETIAISEWTNIGIELRIMFLIAAEKVPANLITLPGQWT
ncbi:hypothetical protein PHLGIDRAFT_121256 [Phlebiopsis gigantea 11061_1 CR5-6]|uniref:Uncharacterized protein n=1 Tax=Phlebiopsis gigantea (strain 11061_1 CR5-6) TaxID=745531 RepID=A0A0C3S2G6_PHLG1|nr:hypothetical protein PHLGIDRAFT_121256 [Phlebiopsis gigantea 11061_1 CR5-6]